MSDRTIIKDHPIGATVRIYPKGQEGVFEKYPATIMRRTKKWTHVKIVTTELTMDLEVGHECPCELVEEMP